MIFNLSFVLAISSIVPAMLGMYFFKNLTTQVKYFLPVILLALITELLAKFFIVQQNRNAVVITYNFYITLYAWLLLIFFKTSKTISFKTYFILLVFTYANWLLHYYNIQMAKVYMTAQALNGAMLVALCIKLLGKELFNTATTALTNPMALIGWSLLLQCLFFILNTLLMFVSNIDKTTRGNIYFTYECINAVCYLVFAVAIYFDYKKMRRNTLL